MGLDYEPQFYVNEIHAFYDIHILNTKILIEIDGDFWHCKPGTKHEIPKYVSQQHNVKNDAKKDLWAANNGIRYYDFGSTYTTIQRL